MTRSKGSKLQRFTRREALKLGAMAATTVVTGARASTWPERNVKIIIPYAAGGPTDIQARIVAEKLQTRWGQPIVVENRTGAGGNIASDTVARAEPDGYTLLLQGSAHATNASLFKNLPYHPVKSFKPLIGMTFQPVILAVHPSLPATNLKEFVDLARKEPGTITLGVAGTGSVSHLAIILLEQEANIKLITVPFQGSAPAQTALLGGHVKGSFLNSTVGTPVIADKTLRGIGSASKERWRELPDLATIAEQGYPGFECTSWFGLLGPKGLPDPIARKVYEDVSATLKQNDVRDRIYSSGLDILNWTPEQFTAQMESDMVKWPPILEKGGLQPQ